MSLATLEFGVLAYYWLADGEYLSVQEKLAAEQPFLESVRDETCEYMDTWYPHPYLGFVHHRNPPCEDAAFNRNGMFGPPAPFVNSPDRFTILLTGGSVASQLANGQRYSLEQMLNERFVTDEGPFVVLNGAIEAWKQPQQAIMLLLHAPAIDGVIVLDGYNEIVFPFLEQHRSQIGKPWESSYRAAHGRLGDPGAGALAAWAALEIRRLTRENSLLGRSKLAYLVSFRLRGALRARAEALASTDAEPNTSIETLFALPPEWSYELRRDWNLRSYRDFVRSMDAIADRHGVRSVFLLQPVPILDKPLTEAEQAVVGTNAYRAEYLLAESSLLALRAEGVAFFSLRKLYADHTGTLYYDPVHQPEDSIGYQMMAGRIVDVLGEAWGLTRR